MAEVTKTIENVDRLFSQIVINGEEHESENYVPPVTIAQTPPPQQEQSPSEQQEASPSEETQGEDVYAVELNNVLHDFVDRDVDPLAETVSGLVEDVATIKGEIPPQASSSNQLADKNFVNSSIATNTANFLGTYTSMADIEAIQNPTNNDYVFLQTTDSAGNNVFDRYKYNAEQEEWLFEYELNNSSFTAEQWATINSGLTSSSVSDAIDALDVAQVGGATKYIESISQVNGKIVATEKTFAVALLDIAHPVGSLYWTSSPENPAVTFGGGTWTQIKDVFVWAKGDNDTVNATGGAKTVTLTADQIPSHTHSVTASGTISVTTNPTFTGSAHSHTYTPSGKIASTSGGTDNKTATESSHTHGYSHTHKYAHTHGYTPSGKIASTSGGTDNKTANESSHTHGAGTLATASSGAHTHRIVTYTADARQGIANIYPPFTNSTDAGSYGGIPFVGCNSNLNINDDWSNLPASGSGTSKVGYCRYTNYGGKHTTTMRRSIIEVDGAHTHSMSGNTGAGSAHSHTAYFTGSAGTTTSQSANVTTDQSATTTGAGSAHSHTAYFTGTQATLTATQGGTISGGAYKFTGSAVTSNSTGGGQAHNNMPPYVVKYCWERTA